MSTNQPSNSDNQEIDLSQISKKIGSFFEGIATKIFNVLFFIKKNNKLNLISKITFNDSECMNCK